jgi:D-galactarolactone cycloisomerase
VQEWSNVKALSSRITRVDHAQVTTVYPRTVGRNAKLGSHGAGFASPIVVLHTDDGETGWGLAPGPRTPDDLVVGRAVEELIDPAVGIREPGLVAFDFALHDLAGRLLDVPVRSMLGDAGPSVLPVYDGAIYFDDLDPDDAPRGVATTLATCAADAELGYRAFKLKIGRGNRWMTRAQGDARDIEVTRAVRAAFPDARLLVDANDGYDVDGMLRYVDAVADCGLYWIEEPFLDDAAALRRLRDHLTDVSPGTLIAEGETSPDLEQLIGFGRDGVMDVVLLDVVSYGFSAWRAVMPRFADLGVVGSPHAWGLPLKTLYAAQLAAGLGNIAVVEGVPGVTVEPDTSAYTFADGMLTVPDLPGFGVPLPS